MMAFSIGTNRTIGTTGPSELPCTQLDHMEKNLSPLLPACRRLLFPLLHVEKRRLRNAVANRVPASRWQGILFRINYEIISG